MDAGYEWVPFYEELAQKIRGNRDRQSDLVNILREAGVKNGLGDEAIKGARIPLVEIDPFSFFGLFNKFQGKERTSRLVGIAKQLGITAGMPTNFLGVPTADPRATLYFYFKYERDEQDIPALWDLFDEVLSGSITDPTFQKALAIRGVGKASLTQGLFWISPRKMFPVDGQTKEWLKRHELPSDFSTAEEYLAICNQIELMSGKPTYVVSHEAWQANQSSEKPAEKLSTVEQNVASNNGISEFVTTPLNMILYGPPGTGKTYLSKQLAVEICDGVIRQDRKSVLKRYESLRQQNRVEFVTFHQSFSYEDFVEGLRPVIDDLADKGEAEYECRPGVFKRICTAAEAALNLNPLVKGGVQLGDKRLFKMSLGDTKRPDEAYLYSECINNGYLLLGYGEGLDFTGCNTALEIAAKLKTVNPSIKPNDYNITSVYYLISEIKVGDLILVSDGNLKYRAIGEVTGKYEYVDRNGKDSYCQKRAVKWIRQYDESQPIDLIFGKRLSQMTVYLMDQASIKRPALEAILAPQEDKPTPDNYVLLIDEVNRANISKVLGELISLLESDKRIGAKEELRVKLPYSQKEFGVPKNLYVIGTMNTADRSIALLDTALRRRFDFREIEPDYTVPLGTANGTISDAQGGEIDLRYVLMAINDRLEFLLGRDQRIGHAYLIGVANLTELNRRFAKQIIPLLQEYFYEDWAGIAKVLAVPKGVASFVTKHTIEAGDLFGIAASEDFGYADNRTQYVIVSGPTGDMYRGLYQGKEAKFAERHVTV